MRPVISDRLNNLGMPESETEEDQISEICHRCLIFLYDGVQSIGRMPKGLAYSAHSQLTNQALHDC